MSYFVSLYLVVSAINCLQRPIS